MRKIDKNDVENFCNHCDWAYQCWMTRKYLFDENPDEKYLTHPHHCDFFSKLEKVLQEYWIQEVAKLHDPADQRGCKNLTVEYIFQADRWSDIDRFELGKLKKKMDGFASRFKLARNKILAHKDQKTINSGKALGQFNAGEDVAYFEALEAFASKVHYEVFGTPYMFDDLVKNDIEIFMGTFVNGLLGSD